MCSVGVKPVDGRCIEGVDKMIWTCWCRTGFGSWTGDWLLYHMCMYVQ